MLREALSNNSELFRGGSESFIKTAVTSGRRQVVDCLTLAFSSDPAARWMYPNSQQYLEYFPNFIRLFGGKAFDTESAFYINSFAAASLWLPPGVGPDEDALTALFQNTVAKELQDDLFAVFDQMGIYHPEEPHWYLPLIGTDPTEQGKGYGSALLRHALSACDREGHAAYLESSNPRNIPLYERHGFEVLGTIQVGSSPPIFPMRREPRVIAAGTPITRRLALNE